MRTQVGCLVALSLAFVAGSVLAADGGRREGYSYRDGKVMVMRDGRESVVTTEITLHNGSRLLPDGFVVTREGRRERFQERQWMTVDGDYVVVDAAPDDFDGYYYDGGRVYVMRERRPVLVDVEVTLGDGRRILPDGTIILRDGSRNRFTEGQRMSREGRAIEGRHISNHNSPEVKVQIDTGHRENNANDRHPADHEKAAEHAKPAEHAVEHEKAAEHAKPAEHEKAADHEKPTDKK